jgi:hypothetical protein
MKCCSLLICILYIFGYVKYNVAYFGKPIVFSAHFQNALGLSNTRIQQRMPQRLGRRSVASPLFQEQKPSHIPGKGGYLQAILNAKRKKYNSSEVVFTDSEILRKKAQAKASKKDRLGFHRIINIKEIPRQTSTHCKILANEEERKYLAKKFKVTGMNYFSANFTLGWKDDNSLMLFGKVAGQLDDSLFDLSAFNYTKEELNEVASFRVGDDQAENEQKDDDEEDEEEAIDENETITVEFKSKLLSNINTKEVIDFEKAQDFEDEIPPSGDIDLAEFAAQEFLLEYASL